MDDKLCTQPGWKDCVSRNTYEQSRAETKKVEEHLKQTILAFEDNNKQAYADGMSQGRNYQAIMEIRGKERYTGDIHRFMEENKLTKKFEKFLYELGKN